MVETSSKRSITHTSKMSPLVPARCLRLSTITIYDLYSVSKADKQNLRSDLSSSLRGADSMAGCYSDSACVRLGTITIYGLSLEKLQTKKVGCF